MKNIKNIAAAIVAKWMKPGITVKAIKQMDYQGGETYKISLTGIADKRSPKSAILWFDDSHEGWYRFGYGSMSVAGDLAIMDIAPEQI